MSLAIFFKLHLGLNPKQALYFGISFGLGLYLVGVSWVYVSLHVYGGMPLWMGSIAVLGFSSLLALFIALPSYIAAKLFPILDTDGYRISLRLSCLAAAWLVFEWGKSWVLTGFPWLDLGYSQTPSWLFALAPIGGVYLVSAAVLITVASLVVMIGRPQKLLVMGSLSVLSLLWVASYFLTTTQWSEPTGDPISIGVVQPNTPINDKWQPEYRQSLMQNLVGQSQKLVDESEFLPAFIVWPETALPIYHQQTDAKFWQSLKHPEVGLLTGLVDSPDYQQSYNAAILLCDGQQQIYRKRHLVPFGEYLPLRFLFNWVLEYLELPMSDFSSWQEQQVLDCGESIKIGLSICYEDAFADEHRRFNERANVLVNISEDAWFGDSFAPHQRLQMAQMRARELARQMVRSANSGPSALIDEAGQILEQTPQFEVASFVARVQPLTGATPYQTFGNWIVGLAGLLLFLLAARVFYSRPNRQA